jgi:hypothetical protein
MHPIDAMATILTERNTIQPGQLLQVLDNCRELPHGRILIARAAAGGNESRVN